MSISNTVIANSVTGSDCLNTGTISVNERNLIEDGTCSPAFSGDPLLASLARYGGDTDTHALLPDSPAIDAGANCPTTDQRGLNRPQGTACDIGAVESPGFHLTYGGGSGQSTMINTAFAQPLTVTATSAGSDPVDGGQVTYTGPAVGVGVQPAVASATITNALASQLFTANSVGGSYVVTATMRGSLDPSVPFTLTNVYPGITVSGNGQEIQIGDALPATQDGTDFGSVMVQGGVVTHTFTMSNVGTMDLTVNDVTINGPAAADFTVTGIITPAMVLPDDTGSFQVRFDPADWSTRAATVTVSSNDPLKSLYDFAIRGEGIEVDLVLDKWASAGQVVPGEPLTYTLIYTNEGPSPATGVVLIDAIPAELRNAAVANSGAVITDTGITPPYMWQVADLTPGDGGTITISGIVSPALRGGYTFTNTAAIASSLDVTLTNNSDQAAVMVLNVSPVTYDDSYQTDEDSPLDRPDRRRVGQRHRCQRGRPHCRTCHTTGERDGESRAGWWIRLHTNRQFQRNRHLYLPGQRRPGALQHRDGDHHCTQRGRPASEQIRDAVADCAGPANHLHSCSP